MPRHRLTFALLLFLATGSLLLALSVGSLALDGAVVWDALMGRGGQGSDIVLTLRLPRALAAFAVGGLLALSGALMQILLRNPLADPYVLGTSGGASIGAMLALCLGWAAGALEGLAFLGAVGSLFLVFALAKQEGAWSQTRLLLTGVIVASGCSAVVALLLSIAPETQLRGMLFWLMGDLAQARHPEWALGTLLGVLLVSLCFARGFNVLSRGNVQAQMLGIPVKQLHWIGVLLAALSTAVAVTQAGAIGFVGLVVPHGLRHIVGNDQRILFPFSVLAGGSLLVLADTLARTLLAPQQLPVGVLTALIGVPLFLFLLARAGRS